MFMWTIKDPFLRNLLYLSLQNPLQLSSSSKLFASLLTYNSISRLFISVFHLLHCSLFWSSVLIWCFKSFFMEVLLCPTFITNLLGVGFWKLPSHGWILILGRIRGMSSGRRLAHCHLSFSVSVAQFIVANLNSLLVISPWLVRWLFWPFLRREGCWSSTVSKTFFLWVLLFNC